MLIMDIFAVDRHTLVIPSTESPLLRSQKKLAEAIAGAEFVTVRGAGHAVLDEPAIFDESL